MSEAARAGQGIIAIRPFGAALAHPAVVHERDPVGVCLRFLLDHPALTTAAMGVSSSDHLHAAVRAVEHE